MLIEALQPLLVRLPDGDLRLQPGLPVEIPENLAIRLLAKAPDKVRPILASQTETVIEPAATTARPSWLTAWRELAETTAGLTAEDPRLQPVLAVLDVCDTAFEADDWAAFRHAAARVRSAMVRLANEALRQQQALDPIPTIQPGDRIEWERADLTAQHGVVDFLHTYPGEVWAFCTLPDGKWTIVNTKYILKREHGDDRQGPVKNRGELE